MEGDGDVLLLSHLSGTNDAFQIPAGVNAMPSTVVLLCGQHPDSAQQENVSYFLTDVACRPLITFLRVFYI